MHCPGWGQGGSHSGPCLITWNSVSACHYAKDHPVQKGEPVLRTSTIYVACSAGVRLCLLHYTVLQ